MKILRKNKKGIFERKIACRTGNLKNSAYNCSIKKGGKEVEEITFSIMQLAGIPAHSNVHSGSD